MRRHLAVCSLLLAASTPALAQVPSSDFAAPSGRNVTATGKTMPPMTGRTESAPSTFSEADVLRAQKAAEDRNKAWDAKMRKTMNTICSGC